MVVVWAKQVLSTRRIRILLLALALSIAAGGCTKTFRSTTKQPRMKMGATQLERTSIPLYIVLRNMNLPRFVFLPNTAYFTWVSKDRLRFHVTLFHSWEQLSDPSRWRVWLEDDSGNRYYPVDLDRRNVRPLTERVDWCPQGTNLNPAVRQQCVRATARTPLQLITVFRGDGDYVFYDDELFNDYRGHMELVMQRPGMEFRYKWDFVEGRDPGESVAAQRGRRAPGRSPRGGAKHE